MLRKCLSKNTIFRKNRITGKVYSKNTSNLVRKKPENLTIKFLKYENLTST